MTALDVTIPTNDGTCNATLHIPEQTPAPAVIMYPDAGGARPTFRDMGDQLASLGYVVLVPDVYYRTPDWAPFSMATVFDDEAERTRLFSLMKSLTPEMSISDAGAFLDFLASRPEVKPGGVGTTGYCMGGRISLTVAGHHDRVTAAASFHGGNLAPENDPNSPHLLAGNVKATVYVAGAEKDASFPEEQKERLQAAYDGAGVTNTIETYPAFHGFAVPDNPTFDETAAERHWKAMEQLYGSVLV
jgi:carboxymethylenebutenolidase